MRYRLVVTFIVHHIDVQRHVLASLPAAGSFRVRNASSCCMGDLRQRQKQLASSASATMRSVLVQVQIQILPA